jgi:hypothetical protein
MVFPRQECARAWHGWSDATSSQRGRGPHGIGHRMQEGDLASWLGQRFGSSTGQPIARLLPDARGRRTTVPARRPGRAAQPVTPARGTTTSAHRHVRCSWSGTTTTLGDSRGSAVSSIVETFVETSCRYIVCILGIPGTAVISPCRQIAWCGRACPLLVRRFRVRAPDAARSLSWGYACCP